MNELGTPLCPSYYGENENGSLEIATTLPDGCPITDPAESSGFPHECVPRTCPDQVGSFPEENALSDQYTQTGGSLICDAHADVEFKLYRQGINEFQSVSETYDLRTY